MPKLRHHHDFFTLNIIPMVAALRASPNPETFTPSQVWADYFVTRSTVLRNQIARENDRLALKISHRLHGNSPLEREDLEQLCRIGLIKAIERFNPYQGAAFSSFAVPYISGEVAHYLRDHFGQVKIPRRAFETASTVKATQRKLAARGREADLTKIALAHGVSADRWEWTLEAVQRKQTANIEDYLHLAGDDDLDDRDRDRLRARLIEELAKLPSFKRICLTERFFEGREEESIARRHKRTVSEINDLINQSLNTIKRRMEAVL